MATAQDIWQFYIVFLQKWILSALNDLLSLYSSVLPKQMTQNYYKAVFQFK